MVQHKTPGDIERTSMGIILEELAEQGLTSSPEHQAVVCRVVHATADFDYARNLVFTPDAVQKGIDALLAGAPVITDTNMAKAGVSRPCLQKLGGEALCFMADAEVAATAREKGTTRAVAAGDKAAAQYPGAVLAFGNAPTGLLRLADWIEQGYRPALVIGAPVGFVNVVESKEHALEVCRKAGVPAILAMGRKGGSGVAAAICNALLYTACGTLDPAARGWN